MKNVTDNSNDASKNKRPKSKEVSKKQEFIATSVYDEGSTSENGK